MDAEKYIIEIRAHCSVEHHALVALYKACCEGEPQQEILDHVEAVLRSPFPQRGTN